MTLARYESDRLAMEKSRLDIGSLVKEVVGHLSGAAQKKNIGLFFSADEALTVAGDPAKLRHLFLNILDNALKCTPPEGKIIVHVRRNQGWAKIEIRDTGPGIAESELPHIFDRFFRGGEGRRQGDFGLGLCLAKSIAEAHRGKIEVTSRVSQGTSFTVLLPLAEN